MYTRAPRQWVRPELPYLNASAVLDRLKGVRRRRDGSGTGLCPAHEDRRPSLDVKDGERGTVLACRSHHCDYRSICDALGIEPTQLFPANEPWGPKHPRRRRNDPDAEQVDLLDFLARHPARPSTLIGDELRFPPERMREELRFIGNIILRAPVVVPEHEGKVQTRELRVVYEAIRELARQGTPRRWYSPLALARELEKVDGLDLVGGKAGLHLWCRLAVGTARRARR